MRTRRHIEFEKWLTKSGVAGTPRDYAARTAIFNQGDRCDSVFYILNGRVQVSVVSKQGREAVVAVLNSGSFFGEESLAGQRIRPATAKTVTTATIMRIRKSAMAAALHKSRAFSDRFVQHLLSRNMRVQEDLVDHVFNSSERRLARILLLLANFGKDGTSELILPRVSQGTLAKMVGTTRARVNFFMNKFRKLGLLDYDGGAGVRVHSSLMNVIIHQ
ncbi:MAG TPA: Crp/Fnr family transcriptional regulator [bacterium]|nr:Crp/Fnr family transcriptional regulator [bacterium]